MGEGVRELEEASEGEGVIEPSSDPRTERVSRSESSSATSGGARFDDRVFTKETLEDGSGAAARRAGRETVETRCFGARGGLLVPVGWNSMIGLSNVSQLYCLANARPLGRGIHVPLQDELSKLYRGGFMG